MNQRFVIKHLSIATLFFLVVSMLFMCFYDLELKQKWLKAVYYSNTSFFFVYLFWIIKKTFKVIYISKLATLIYFYFAFDIIHNLYYVFFGGWSIWIDRATLMVFIVLLIRLMIWLRTTG